VLKYVLVSHFVLALCFKFDFAIFVYVDTLVLCSNVCFHSVFQYLCWPSIFLVLSFFAIVDLLLFETLIYFMLIFSFFFYNVDLLFLQHQPFFITSLSPFFFGVSSTIFHCASSLFVALTFTMLLQHHSTYSLYIYINFFFLFFLFKKNCLFTFYKLFLTTLFCVHCDLLFIQHNEIVKSCFACTILQLLIQAHDFLIFD
jgi:hypothetical protein